LDGLNAAKEFQISFRVVYALQILFSVFLPLRQKMCYTPAMNDFSLRYHKILCGEFPRFLDDYISLPILQRLGGIGLLCGTDWTHLFKNDFFYSRLEHSVGTALIVWNFTKDKAATISALLHDISTPAFSHVNDFKNGDAKNQTSTEEPNRFMIRSDSALQKILLRDKIELSLVDDFHIHSVAELSVPCLCADRLEYMYPSGRILCRAWTIPQIKKNYESICILQNERGQDELGFSDENQCLLYTKKFAEISLILQKNEDKFSMQILADVISQAEKIGLISAGELFRADEKSLIKKFDGFAKKNPNEYFSKLFRTFRGTKKIFRSEKKIDGAYCVSVDVKKRWVDPLVKISAQKKAVRISQVNDEAKKIIDEFLNFNDAKFGCGEFL
jgi:hypothetical protein